MRRRAAFLAAVAAALLDVGALLVFRRVHEARSFIAAFLTTSPDDAWFSLGKSLETEARALAALGAGLVLSALIVGVLGVVWARRRPGRGLAGVGVVVPAVLGGLAGGGLLWGFWAFRSYRHVCCIDPGLAYRMRYEEATSHATPYAVMRVAILAIAAIATGVVLARARRLPEWPLALRKGRAPRLLGPAVMFAAGLAAFALTRAERDDTRSPMPLLQPGDSVVPHWAAIGDLPPALGCDPYAPDAPTLVLGRSGWLLDGMLVGSPDEAGKLLKSKRELWQMIQPNKPFPGLLELAVPSATPLDAVRPMIEAAHAAGYPAFQVQEVRPAASWASHTLGEVPYQPRACALQVPPGHPLPDAPTWGEMARALAR